MRKQSVLEVCKWCFHALVVGMAVPAGHPGVGFINDAMQRFWIAQLGSHIRMAGHAAVRHACFLPEGRMAGRAIIAETGMGAYTPQGCPRLCIQFTRAE